MTAAGYTEKELPHLVCCKGNSWIERKLCQIKVRFGNYSYQCNPFCKYNLPPNSVWKAYKGRVKIEVWSMLSLLEGPHSTNSFYRALLPPALRHPSVELLGSGEPSLATTDLDNLSSLPHLMIL